MGRSDQDGSSEEDDEEEQLLDCELYLIRKMRLAFAASLRMLEAARDDMNHMSSRMDRLRNASWLCRKALAEKKNGKNQQHQPVEQLIQGQDSNKDEGHE